MPRDLFGRDEEKAELSALMKLHRLVSIVGPGGVGKTALAAHLARPGDPAARQEGVLVELAALPDSGHFFPALARALGLKLSRQMAKEVVLEGLRERPCLLVLDNCEHLLPGLAADIAALLAAFPALGMLATSQSALNLREEQVYRLGALRLAESGASVAEAADAGAVRLFCERARAADHRFALADHNVATVVEICRRLDGIPLALELAAARVRTLGVEGLLARLDDRLRWLTGGALDQPERHRTLRAAIEWSWSLLEPEEKRVFRRLGLFAGSFDLAACEALAGEVEAAGPGVADLLGQLCDKSLVTALSDSQGRMRYCLLESLRQFALEQLADAGEVAGQRERLVAYFLALAEAGGAALAGPDQGAWLARLDHERDNFAAVHRMCDDLPEGAERGLRLANALMRYWFNRDAILLGQRIVSEALARPGAGRPTPSRALALMNLGRMFAFRGLDAEASQSFSQAIGVGQLSQAPNIVIESMGRLGYAQISLGDRVAARGTLEAACALAEGLGQYRREALIAQSNMAELERMEGHFEAALRRYEACLVIDQEEGDRQATMISLNNLALTALALRRLPQVREHLRASLAICDELGSRRGRLVVMEACSGLAAELGDWNHAVRFDSAARHLTEAMGRRRDVADEVLLAPMLKRARQALGRRAAQEESAAATALGYDAAIELMHDWLDSRQDLTPLEAADPVLTSREQEILSLIARGYGNGDIARLLEISVLTVRTHRQRLMDKLQLHNAAEITAYAVRMGWYDPH